MRMNYLKSIFGTVITMMALMLMVNCDNADSNKSETARIQLKLVDEPGDYEQVNIEIIDIQYRSSEEDESWQSFTPESGYPLNVDITELIAGNSLLLTDEVVPVGLLKQVRLVLSDNNTLKIEGEDDLIPLDTPSAQQSGLKLNLDKELEAGFVYSFILDWNVQKSIVKAGNSGKYILKPVIKVNAEVNSGSISGKVVEIIEDIETPIANQLIEVYTTEGDLVKDTLTNENGDFVIQGLEAGGYIIKIMKESYIAYESLEVNVEVGNVESVGTIILELE
ncbi:Carboxypeptidase regulatory-like domain-containing protein [Algibacter luteus]|uniref:Carboxypeptidase regulatory-like domain-containing protein n=2 Tax=Algibacter luteus TaxID=1178825 RepID=A0A1M6AQN7_9FLAO|nr:Carboxypeptidase regulatory-like domain-containing protein [Algibacter luteus]